MFAEGNVVHDKGSSDHRGQCHGDIGSWADDVALEKLTHGFEDLKGLRSSEVLVRLHSVRLLTLRRRYITRLDENFECSQSFI